MNARRRPKILRILTLRMTKKRFGNKDWYQRQYFNEFTKLHPLLKPHPSARSAPKTPHSCTCILNPTQLHLLQKPHTAAPAPKNPTQLHLKPHSAAPKTPHSCTSEQSSMCSYTDTADCELLQLYRRTLQLHLRARQLQFKSLTPSANLAVHTAFLSFTD